MDNFKDSLNNNEILYEFNNKKLIIKRGNYIIKENIIIPESINVTIEEGTNFLLKYKKSIVFKGSLYAVGTPKNKIMVKNFVEGKPFGTFAVLE